LDDWHFCALGERLKIAKFTAKQVLVVSRSNGVTMARLTEPRLRNKDAIIVYANGRPVTYLNSPLPGLLGWLLRLARRVWHHQ